MEEAVGAEQYICYRTQRRIGDFAYGRTSKAPSMQYSGNLAFSFQTLVHQLQVQTDTQTDRVFCVTERENTRSPTFCLNHFK